MLTVTFRFHGDLNDFLPLDQREQDIVCALAERTAVKHPIESIGVPHPEVEAIGINGRAVDFAYRVGDGDYVHVYPRGEMPPLDGFVPLRPPLPVPVRFTLDTHLGRLAGYLRLLGFDTLYRNDYSDPELACIAADETRVLLTRDRGLLKHKIVTFGHCVRDTDPRRQLVDVLRRYDLVGQVRPWQRCVRCNGLLEPVEKATILDRLEPKTRLYYDEFQRCADCGRIYWQGSHFERLGWFVEGVLTEAEQ